MFRLHFKAIWKFFVWKNDKIIFKTEEKNYHKKNSFNILFTTLKVSTNSLSSNSKKYVLPLMIF